MSIPQEHLFTLPIPAHESPAAPSPGGKITVSRLNTAQPEPTEPSASHTLSSHPAQGKPRPGHDNTSSAPPIYLLTFHSPPDNRLTPAFLSTFLHALLRLQYSNHPPGLLLTTSLIPKFYSNGLDLATFTTDTKIRYLYPLWRKLLTYPMPTCAVINGHAFAGGLMLSMFHDYRIMNPHRGWLCLNELEFDAELAPGMAAIFKAKVSNATFRSVLLEARRLTSLQALEMGIVDGLGGLEEAVKIMSDVEGGYGRGAVVVGARGRRTVYGNLKEEMYKDVLRELDTTQEGEEKMWEERTGDRERREMEERMVVERLSKEKAKL